MVIRDKKDNSNSIKQESPEERKKRILEELSKFDADILALACMYAQGYKLSGEDVTKTWVNVIQNNQFIEDLYRRGYEDAFNDFQNKRRKDFYHKVTRDL